MYRAYLTDPDLQDARARWPFVPVWDNHEFSWQGYQSIQVLGGEQRSHGAACNYARLVALKRKYDPTNLLRRKATSIREFEMT